MVMSKESVSLTTRLAVLACVWIVIGVVAYVVMPENGPTPRIAVAFFSVTVTWTAMFNSVFAGQAIASDTAFEIGRKYLLVPCAAIATVLAFLAASAAGDEILLVLQVLNGAVFGGLFVYGRGSTGAIAEKGTRRKLARQSADDARGEVAGLVSDVQVWGVEDPAPLLAAAKGIEESISMMGVRAGVDTSVADADIAAVVKATRRRLSSSAPSFSDACLAELNLCADAVHGLVEARERLIKN